MSWPRVLLSRRREDAMHAGKGDKKQEKKKVVGKAGVLKNRL